MRRELEGGFELDDDRSRVDIETVWRFLCDESYWARGRTRETTERLIREASLVIGCYKGGRLAGFCRVVSDGEVFAYLADVFVLPEFRGNGVGVEIVREAVENGPFAKKSYAMATK